MQSAAAKRYRIEIEAIGNGPVAAVEFSVWSPRALGRDRLLYVEFPFFSAQAPAAGPTDEMAREHKRLFDDLTSRIRTEPESTWTMDQKALLQESNRVVVALEDEYNEVEGGLLGSGYTASWFLGQGNKMAVHRARLA